MAKRKSRGGDEPPAKRKGLRKQLKKAEADLGKAVSKRDRAQARVEAMSIIVDELRSQLADLEKAGNASTGTDTAETGAGTAATPRTRKRGKVAADAAGPAPDAGQA